MKRRTLLQGVVSSMEAIAFQMNTRLFDQLTTQVNGVRLAIAQGKAVDFSQINKTIKDHTGMCVEVILGNGKMDAHIAVMPLTANSPIFHRTSIRATASNNPAKNLDELSKIGTVDLRTGKVSGVFADTKPSKVSIGLELIKRPMWTDQELAAVILHEIGHLFTYYYTLSKQHRTNYIMDQLIRYGDMERSVQIEFITQVNKVTGLDANVDNPNISELMVQVPVYGVKEIQREIGTKYLDNQMTEIIADQYAVRFGAGVHLTLALDKLGRDSFFLTRSNQYDSKLWTVGSGTIGLLMFYIPIHRLIYMRPQHIGMVIEHVVTTTFRLDFWRQPQVYYTFLGMAAAPVIDMLIGRTNLPIDPMDRYTRIRNDILQLLKNPDLPRDVVSSTLQDINAIDEIMKGLNTWKRPLQFIRETIYDGISGKGLSVKYQQRLEELANNQLFKQAAEFKLQDNSHVS